MSRDPRGPGLHVALILDGNGRWARARGLPRLAGHRRGIEAVRRIVEAAPGLGVSTLTLYAFSADNWRRPAAEVSALLALLETYLVAERDRCVRHGIRLGVIGRRDRIPASLFRRIRETEEATSYGDRLYLRIAVDYSSRQAILRAARRASRTEPRSYEGFLRLINLAVHSDPATPEVDLLIRTSGERRLSDFLLWELAYAELVFVDRLWPDFDGSDLERAVAEFATRERRYGRVAAAVSTDTHRAAEGATRGPL